MTLTMLIMAALPSQDQITLSLHIKHKKRQFRELRDRQRGLGDEGATPVAPSEEKNSSSIN
jgi:hypothetical protein